ncbi:MAG: hypothetical protein PHQ59_00885 [Candidatus Daviesbacteria bacterium]|nr:hypothetical protein [Candidatus Daviesbacteria bacterium]
MRGEKEHQLHPNTKVWIGDPINPVPPGTYNRFYTSKEPGRKQIITFKKIDQTQEEYQSDLTPMSIEYTASKPRQTDTTVNLGTYNPWGWEELSTIRRIHYDQPFPQILGQPPFTPKEGISIITNQKLREVGSAGFFIENCGNRHEFLTENIIAVFSNHVKQTVTIQLKNGAEPPCKATYSLNKIGNCGALPKKDQKVI